MPSLYRERPQGLSSVPGALIREFTVALVASVCFEQGDKQTDVLDVVSSNAQ